MKVNVLIEKEVKETEIVIHCNEVTDEILNIQNFISKQQNSELKLIFYKKNQEYYLDLSNVLFFETSSTLVYAHTKDEIYEVKYRLYELEKILPHQFLRISKSTIINVDQIYSLTKNITSSSLVEFYHTHKKVYASRKYLKILHDKIKEERYHEKN